MKAANGSGGSGREDRVSALQTTAAALADSVKTLATGGGISRSRRNFGTSTTAAFLLTCRRRSIRT